MPIDWHPVLVTPSHPAPPVPPEELGPPLSAACRRLAASPTGRVGVAVGSRGIPQLVRLIRAAVETLRDLDLQVYVVPAMGSHGGGRPEGQRDLLRDLGVSSKNVGADLLCSEELEQVGTTPSGIPVWCDAAVWQLDWILPVNRVKPHTAFRGRVESGPSKMLAVGPGRSRSATTCHRYGLADAVPEVASFWLESGKSPLGVAVLEDTAQRLTRIEVLKAPTPAWFASEEDLLAEARRTLPRLPWPDLDLLVVERIGKDVSGTGMDLNVVGLQRRFPHDPTPPRIRRIVALELSPNSHGNANGVGYADVVTRALANEIDREATYANARTTGFLEAARLPYVAEDEGQAVAVALASLPGLDAHSVRAARIRDTGSLQRVEVSPALLQALPPGVHKPCE